MPISSGSGAGPGGDRGDHVGTISHDGRFWDVYLELEPDPGRGALVRGRLAFSPADGQGKEEAVSTTAIIVEPDVERARAKARGFEDHQLVAFLRSSLP